MKAKQITTAELKTYTAKHKPFAISYNDCDSYAPLKPTYQYLLFDSFVFLPSDPSTIILKGEIGVMYFSNVCYIGLRSEPPIGDFLTIKCQNIGNPEICKYTLWIKYGL